MKNSFTIIEELSSNGCNPYLPIVKGYKNNKITFNNYEDCLMFGTCDYLGLTQNEEVKTASINAIKEFGTNTYGAQVFCGYLSIHNTLEEKIKSFFNKEASILFPSGMAANIGLLSTIYDSDDVIINDRLNHVSIFMGSDLSQAETRTYPHQNMKKLRTILEDTQDRKRRLIVVDGLFSADGDYANLPAIVKLAEEFNAEIMVDEAHSFGTIGDNGKGAAEYFNVLDKVDIITGTMSKGLGSVGGFLVAKKSYIDKIRYSSPTYTSSRGNTPAVAAASLEGLKILEHSGAQLREKLQKNYKYIMNKLKEFKFDIGDTESHIIPVLIGETETTIKLANWLLENGVMTAAMIPPSVPHLKARLRIGVTSWHTKKDCDSLIETLIKSRKYFEY